MAPHSSTLAWKIPWMEELGRLQSMGSLRVRHDWATSLSLFTFMHWRMKWQPTPVFLLGESQGRGAWWAAVYGVAQSWTRLKRLSSRGCLMYNIFIIIILVLSEGEPTKPWSFFSKFRLSLKILLVCCLINQNFKSFGLKKYVEPCLMWAWLNCYILSVTLS